MSEFNPAAAIPLVADRVDLVRKADVFRLLDTFESRERRLLATYLLANRPDLAEEVHDVMDELADDELADNPRPRGY